MNNQNKMDIQKNGQELKLYMFTVQTGLMQVEFPEDFKTVMAYTDGDAINMILKDYPSGSRVFMKKRADVMVRKIVDIIDMPAPIKITRMPPAPKEKTPQEFINSMLLIADKFVTEKRDQTTLKRIINKIKI
jgi:hypothetical protein